MIPRTIRNTQSFIVSHREDRQQEVPEVLEEGVLPLVLEEEVAGGLDGGEADVVAGVVLEGGQQHLLDQVQVLGLLVAEHVGDGAGMTDGINFGAEEAFKPT